MRNHTNRRLSHSWSVLIGLVVVIAMCVAAWFFSPKGENQVYVCPSALAFFLPPPFLESPIHTHKSPLGKKPYSLWRSSLILSIVSCFLMWAITFLSQLHPLIEPRRSDLRKEYVHH